MGCFSSKSAAAPAPAGNPDKSLMGKPEMTAKADSSGFSLHDGYISDGGDLSVREMTTNDAKELANTLPGCAGFTHEGPPTDKAVKVYFKGKWDNAVSDVKWTSYKLQVQPVATKPTDDSTTKAPAMAEQESLVQNDDVRKKVGACLDEALASGELADALASVVDSASSTKDEAIVATIPATGSLADMSNSDTNAAFDTALAEDLALSKEIVDVAVEGKSTRVEGGWFCCGGNKESDIVVNVE